MSREWFKLRSWGGSQEKAFEELCCQLAASEEMPDGSRFTRKGTPDAGVECFWTIPNGEERAWQAKFFFQMQEVQWRDLDDSVRSALSKHPKMTQYCVCLPLDLADPRLTDNKTKKRKRFAQDAWNSRVQKWTQWAANAGMRVSFAYWGEHEIWNRLTRDEHRGRLLFWFNEQWFSDEWLRQRVDEAHKNAGKRYIPSLHVALDIEHSFEALGRSPEFFVRLSDRIGSVRRELDHVRMDHISTPAVQEAAREIAQVVRDLAGTGATTRSAIEPLPLAEVARLADRGEELAFRFVAALQQLPAVTAKATDAYSYERHHLYLLQDRFADLKEFVRSPEASVANAGILLLVGDAGTGKTHMFCEIARRRLEAGGPTVLFLGEQFVPGEPWAQMLTILGVRCDRDEFLGALEAVAEARGTRALILVDAINEEHGQEIWPKYLSGMLTQIKRHPRIGLALSVRSSYETSVLPTQLETDGTIVRFVHSGFEGHEEQGVDRYFAHYGIAPPSFPILDPEFSNPLFLRVLCESLQARSLSRIPQALSGFTAVFQFFLESVNEKLARPDLLDYDAQQPIVMQAVQRLVTAMVANETDWIDRSTASELLATVLPRPGFDKSLFRRLVDEGVLTEELIPVLPSPRASAGITRRPVVRFQYQRFADHLIVRHLLSPHIEAGRPEAAFEAGQLLGRILADPIACRRNQGIVEALAVMLPEDTGRELPTLVPQCSTFDSVKEAVSASLVWRRASSILPATWSYVEQEILQDTGARRTFLRTLVLVAPDPDHPYNARFLHEWLFPMKMVERDALWSVFVSREYATGGAVARLLRWTESIPDGHHHAPAVTMLAATALAWLLTSSNRLLRDRATKALVALLSSRLPMAGELIRDFAAVNDDYVLERVAAAAYGAAMRSRSAEHVASLATICYEGFFEYTRPPADALTRDYLRGIIELALHLKPSMSVDTDRIRPPYGAPLPDGFDPNQDSYPDLDWSKAENLPLGLRSVHHSVTNHDFKWYVLSSLCGKFLAAKLGDPLAPTRREFCKQFEKGLSAVQAMVWETYRGPRLNLADLELLLGGESRHDNGHAMSEPPNISDRRDQFESTLTDSQKDLFRREVRPYVEEGYPSEARTHVSLGAVQHFILDRVFAVGWRQELDDFDRSSVISSGDSEHKVERIGKKYQWIAFYEMIGLLADNFQCTGDSYDAIGHYDGPWQITYGRNIDPSLLLRSKPTAPWRPSWWAPKACDSWADELDDLAWLKLDFGMPKIDQALLLVKDPGQVEWVVLEGHYEWTQPTSAGREYGELPQRQIRYTVTSCLVRVRHSSAVLKVLLSLGLPKQEFLDPRHNSDAFLGEMHWAPVYMSQLNPYHGYDEWTKESLPHPVLVTTEQYYAEPGSFDASMDESVTLACPSHWIVQKMGLQWKGIEGEWCGSSPCRTVFDDPSTRAPGPSVLLASRNDLEQFLREQGCALIWTITGTKWVIGGDFLGRKPTGRRLMSGALRMKRGSLSGDVRSWLELPGSERHDVPQGA